VKAAANDESRIGVYQALGALEETRPLVDLRALARDFVERRLANTASVEGVRAKALAKLSAAVDDPESKLTAGRLLEIIDVLNNSSKEDMNTIMTATAGGGPPRPGLPPPGGNQYYNLFLNQAAPEAPGLPRLTKAFYPVLDELVEAADAVTRAAPAGRKKPKLSQRFGARRFGAKKGAAR
jgi:hypothetical protein